MFNIFDKTRASHFRGSFKVRHAETRGGGLKGQLPPLPYNSVGEGEAEIMPFLIKYIKINLIIDQ